MTDKAKRLRLRAPISGPPFAPARNRFTPRSNQRFGSTLGRCRMPRLETTVGPNVPIFRDHTQCHDAPSHHALDRIPKNEPTSQAA
jgi:hypothetical protein